MTDTILLESGDKLLLETGSYILLEIQIPELFKRIILTRSQSDFTIKSRNPVKYNLLGTNNNFTLKQTNNDLTLIKQGRIIDSANKVG